MTDEYNAGQMAMFNLIPYPVNFQSISPRSVHDWADGLFHDLRNSVPHVVMVDIHDDEPFDVMTLRWMFKGGVSPLVLCASDAAELAELVELAGTAATVFKMPVFLAAEDCTNNCKPVKVNFQAPQLQFEVTPLDGSDLTPEEFELAKLEARHARPPRGIKTVHLDAPRDGGRPEWLLISYGATVGNAGKAAEMARKAGQRVDVLHIRLLWPLPEEEILRAAMGIRHVVVAERNCGQYAQEIRRLLPEVPVISATSLFKPVPVETILNRLQRSPRCC